MAKKNRKAVSEVYGFHVTKTGYKIRGYRDGEIAPGTTYKATGRLKLCKVGCHASVDLADAASFRVLKPGRVVSYVKVYGDVRIGARKVMGRYRKVLSCLKPEDVPYEECGQVHDGHDAPCTAKRVPRQFIEDVQEKLMEMYRRTKRQIDGNDTIVALPR